MMILEMTLSLVMTKGGRPTKECGVGGPSTAHTSTSHRCRSGGHTSNAAPLLLQCLPVQRRVTAAQASQIQEKGSALVWKFDEVDPEFGQMQATELRDHLQAAA